MVGRFTGWLIWLVWLVGLVVLVGWLVWLVWLVGWLIGQVNERLSDRIGVDKLHRRKMTSSYSSFVLIINNY